MGNELMANGEMYMQKAKQQSLSVFSNAESFGLAARMADTLARSTIVPKAYQGNPSNCMIAIEMASRINTSPMMVMQNLYIVNGSPAWSSQWIIAMINNSGRYKTELRFDITYGEDGKPTSCKAWAEDFSGHRVEGPTITMEMAEKEGWISKNGSKWKNMPEVMIRYRAASFFGRLNCPDMIMGIYSQEEVVDGMGDVIDEPVISETGSQDDFRTITQEERQAFLAAIKEKYEDKDQCNAVFTKVLETLGIKSTTNMKYHEYKQALELIKNLPVEVTVEEGGSEEPKHEVAEEN